MSKFRSSVDVAGIDTPGMTLSGRWSRGLLGLTLAVSLAGCKDGTGTDDGIGRGADSGGTQASGEADPPELQRLSIAVAKPWSLDVRHDEDDEDQSLIVGISHSEDYLAVWMTDSERHSEERYREAVGFHPDNVLWFDWDRDGEPAEILLTVEGEKQAQLWETGFWGLKKTGTVTVQDPPQNLLPADLDQDGHWDVVLGPYGEPRLTLLWGEGDFRFTETQLPTLPTPSYPKIVDWDGDGDDDIVWSEWEAGSIRWADNRGERRFELIELQPPGPGVPRQVDVADIDEDGHPDLIVSLEVGGAARILYNDGSGGIRASEDIPAPVIGYSDAAVGRDRDGMLLALSETDVIVLARRDADGGWQRRQIPAQDLKMDMQLVDVDRDGETDLIYAETSGPQLQVIYGPLWEGAEALSQRDEK